jgi:hypothetical protein
MKKVFELILLSLLISFLNGQIKMYHEPEPRKPERPFGLGYTYSVLFIDTEDWNTVRPNGSFPKLDGSLKTHGIMFFGKMGNGVLLGVEASAGRLASENESGNTIFHGGTGGLFLEVRKKELVMNWYGCLGLSANYGRYNYISMNDRGIGKNGHTDALYLIPSAGLGYNFDDTAEIKIKWSYPFSYFDKNTWFGEEEDYEIHPDAHTVSFSFRYYIPLI